MAAIKKTTFYSQGGVIGAIIGCINFAWFANLPFTEVADIMAIVASIALAIGRLGCYSYGCCHGLPTKSRFHVVYNNVESKVLRMHPELQGVPLHPTQLYSALFNLLLFSVLMLIYFNVEPSGIIGGVFLISYCGFRLTISSYRSNDDDPLDIVRENQVFTKTAALLIVAGVVMLGYSMLVPANIIIPVSALSWDSFYNLVIKDSFIFLALFIAAVYLLAFGIHKSKLGCHF